MVASSRIQSIDIIRGIAIIFMTLDHTREYFYQHIYLNPTDLQTTTIGLFLTRWITNFCAPAFVLLAGVSVYLLKIKKNNSKEVSRFLITRGIWLIFLELTIINFAWFFDVGFHHIYLGVIWVMGCCMIILAALIYLPVSWVSLIGIMIIFCHNLLENLHPQALISQLVLAFLDQKKEIALTHTYYIHLSYPILPWLGVICVGYGLGHLYSFPKVKRKKIFFLISLGCITLFLILRGINIYGDPNAWNWQKYWLFSFLSFINTTKYPPSLLFLLMTLGPVLSLMALLEDFSSNFLKKIAIIGSVPMLYYMLHLYLLHSMAILIRLLDGNTWQDFNFATYLELPKDSGYSLKIVYLIWGMVVLGLYPICKKFGDYKLRNKAWWLSYL